MIEIKFRAFGTEKADYQHKGRMIYDIQETSFDLAPGGHGEIYYTSFGDYINNEEYIIMQYTGLKDKNKKEIYEGDIVEFHITNTKHKPWSEFFEVKFEKGRFEPFQNNFSNMKYDNINSEVIGNIYENPELLENQE